jgi:hypothetical protein
MMTLMRRALVGAVLPVAHQNIVTTLSANISFPSPRSMVGAGGVKTPKRPPYRAMRAGVGRPR